MTVAVLIYLQYHWSLAGSPWSSSFGYHHIRVLQLITAISLSNHDHFQFLKVGIHYTVERGYIFEKKVTELFTFYRYFIVVALCFLFYQSIQFFFVFRLNSERYIIHKNLISALFLAQVCLLVGMNVTSLPVIKS